MHSGFSNLSENNNESIGDRISLVITLSFLIFICNLTLNKTPVTSLHNIHKLLPRFPKTNDNRRWLLKKIMTKYIITPK